MTEKENNMSDLISTLKLAGMNETEAKVYLACLELGPASAWNIYLKTGIKRPTCYAVLDSLVADGIAAKTNDGTRTIFSVVKPNELLQTIESRKNEFKESLPLFDAIASDSIEKPRIRLFEGIDGVRQAYMLSHEQPEGSDVLVCGSSDVWMQYEEANRAYIAERLAKKIKLRVLYSDTKNNRAYSATDKKELRESRFLPEDTYSPKVETQIFGNTVIYIAHSEKSPFATVIENSAIAHDERERFNALWKIAKK